jgi:hypothetical protein
MRKNTERRNGVGLSASTLSSCPRQVILQARHDYYEDPSDYYARWQGTFGHYAVEMDGPYPGVVQEVRFYRTVNIAGMGIEISGQPDWIDIPNRTIEDHKFTQYAPKDPRDSHVQQVNVYRWLVEGGHTREVENPIPDNYRATTLKIHYYHGPSQGSKSRHTCHEIPVWPDMVVEAYIRSKLEPYATYKASGSLAAVGLQNQPDMAWMKDYCVFRHACNVGQCCLQRLNVGSYMP